MYKVLIFAAALGLFWVIAVPGTRPSPPTERLDPSELVATISQGEEVEISDHLREGRWTVVEFAAEW